jgi:hypothetical protein
MRLSFPRILSLLLLYTLNACTIYREVAIEVLRPRELSVGQGSDVVFLYRNFKYENDTLQNYYRDDYDLRKDKKNDGLNIDSLVSIKALFTLASELQDKDVVNGITVMPFNTLPRITGQKLAPLPKELVQMIGSESASQKLISLETLSWFFSRFTENSDAGESVEVILAGIWALYDVHSGAIEKHEAMVDTLFWQRRNEDGERIQLPPRVTSLELATEVYAINFAKKFTTSWETVQRLLIIPPVQEFSLAAAYAGENKWEEALELWQRYAPERYGRLSVSARYNTALSYEMLNEIDQAVQWIDQALIQARIYRNKSELKLVQNYKEILAKRNEEIRNLIQLNNE